MQLQAIDSYFCGLFMLVGKANAVKHSIKLQKLYRMFNSIDFTNQHEQSAEITSFLSLEH